MLASGASSKINSYSIQNFRISYNPYKIQFIDIFRIDGFPILSFKLSSIDIKREEKKSIRKIVIEHSRKLCPREYDNEVQILKYLTSSILYRAFQTLFIVFMLPKQEQIFEINDIFNRLILLIQESLEKDFKSKQFPQYFYYEEWKKIDKLKKMIKQIFFPIPSRSLPNKDLFQIIQISKKLTKEIQQKVKRNHELSQIEQISSKMLEKAGCLRQNSLRVRRWARINCSALVFVIIINLLMVVYYTLENL